MDLANLTICHSDMKFIAAEFFYSVLVEVRGLVKEHVSDEAVLQFVEGLVGDPFKSIYT